MTFVVSQVCSEILFRVVLNEFVREKNLVGLILHFTKSFIVIFVVWRELK